MLKKFINKHRMLVAVVDFLTVNAGRLTFVPAFAGLIEQLQETMANITTQEQAQLASSKGHTQTKLALREETINTILDIVKRTRAYAIVTNNMILRDAVNYTPSQLDAMPQDSLVSVASRIIETLGTQLTLLADYGVTQVMLDTLSSQMEAYAAALPGAKRVIASRKTATSGLADEFAAADELLRKIDALMEIISTESPAFYNEYRNVRVIVDLKGKGRSTGISGRVTDAATGQSLANVKVSLAGSSAAVLSDATGQYSLDVSTAGIYTLTAVLGGYTELSRSYVEVKTGEFTGLDLQMTAAN